MRNSIWTCCSLSCLLLFGSTVSAQWQVRELNLDFGQLNDHYETYSFLTSTTDRNELEQRGEIGTADLDAFAEEFEFVNFGGTAGNWPGEDNGSFFTGDNYALDARTRARIPAGTWDIAIGTNDGGQITVPGANFTRTFGVSDPLAKGSGDQIWYDLNRSNQGWTGGTFTVATGTMDTLIHASFHDNTFGDAFEIAIRDASDGTDDNPQLGQRGWELLTNGSYDWRLAATDDLPMRGLDGLPIASTGTRFTIDGQAGQAIGKRNAPTAAVIVTVDDETQTQSGLHQRWVKDVATPNNINTSVAALVAKDADSARFHDDFVWWDGNSTDLLDVQEYPEGVEALGFFSFDGTDNNNYVSWLSGEINLSEGTTRLRAGIDEYEYLAIDVNGNGVAGDQPGEVLLNDNEWVSSTGARNNGEMSTVALATVPEDGWYKIELIVGETGGGDAAVLYWDEGNENNFPMAVPFDDVGSFPPADFAVPTDKLRGVTRGDIEGAQLFSAFEAGTTIEIDVSSDLFDADQVLLVDPTFETTINLDGLTVKINPLDELVEGDLFVPFVADNILTQGVTWDLPGGLGAWDLSKLGVNGRITFVGENGVVIIAGDCNSDGVLGAGDLECVSTIEERDIVLDALGTLPGDLDGNGNVAFPDFLVLSANFGNATKTRYVDANIDLAGGVGFSDFLVLSANFGKTPAGAAAVPEPASMVMLGLGALLLSLGRCRRR